MLPIFSICYILSVLLTVSMRTFRAKTLGCLFQVLLMTLLILMNGNNWYATYFLLCQLLAIFILHLFRPYFRVEGNFFEFFKVERLKRMGIWLLGCVLSMLLYLVFEKANMTKIMQPGKEDLLQGVIHYNFDTLIIFGLGVFSISVVFNISERGKK